MKTLFDLRPLLPITAYEHTAHSFLVHWDEDVDGRVLDVASALAYRNPVVFKAAHLFAESKGHLRVHVHPSVDAARLERELRSITAMFLEDEWSVTVEPSLDFSNPLERVAYALLQIPQ